NRLLRFPAIFPALWSVLTAVCFMHAVRKQLLIVAMSPFPVVPTLVIGIQPRVLQLKMSVRLY
ncbi:uncharacterized protein METZ01_LOCUS138771, partial [marine metagenome]